MLAKKLAKINGVLNFATLLLRLGEAAGATCLLGGMKSDQLSWV